VHKIVPSRTGLPGLCARTFVASRANAVQTCNDNLQHHEIQTKYCRANLPVF